MREEAPSPTIRPTRPEEVEELGRFLTQGFGTPPGAPFARADVLLWKYFDPIDPGDASPRSFLARHEGRIVGHVGVSPTAFQVVGQSGRPASTLHMMDWLGSRERPAVGASLMRQVHRQARTQYGLGGSQAGRQVIGRGGYELAASVPLFVRILRPGHRLRRAEGARPADYLRAGRDLILRAGSLLRRRPRPPMTWRPVGCFGAEVERVLAACPLAMVHTRRDPAILNHRLRCPAAELAGGLLLDGGLLLGFGLIGLVERGRVRVGKVVELYLDRPDASAWEAALEALAAALHDRGADLIEAYGSTPWMARALARRGYREVDRLEFRLRDRDHLLPRDLPFHLSPLEADYAYT